MPDLRRNHQTIRPSRCRSRDRSDNKRSRLSTRLDCIMSCPHTTGCTVYALFHLQASLKTWQIRYCDGDHGQCERFRLLQKAQAVPSQMLPNGKFLPVLKPSGG